MSWSSEAPQWMPDYRNQNEDQRRDKAACGYEDPDLPEHLNEYEVNFKFVVATFYQSQLRSAEEPLSNK